MLWGLRMMLVVQVCMDLRGMSRIGAAAAARAVLRVGLLRQCTVQLLLLLPRGCDGSDGSGCRC